VLLLDCFDFLAAAAAKPVRFAAMRRIPVMRPLFPTDIQFLDDPHSRFVFMRLRVGEGREVATPYRASTRNRISRF